MSTAEQTKARILRAATEEFSAHGIAGARVDRIAERSGMSKPMIYAYFGAKNKLFDSVFQAHVLENTELVPFTADDLAQYTVRLYDRYVADPDLVRLLMWKRLERDATGYLYPGLEHVDAEHLRDIVSAQAAGRVRDDIPAEDVWSLVVASATTWAQASLTEVAAAADSEDQHERRRASLSSYVTAALRPPCSLHA